MGKRVDFRVELTEEAGTIAVIVSLDIIENGSRVDAVDFIFHFIAFSLHDDVICLQSKLNVFFE